MSCVVVTNVFFFFITARLNTGLSLEDFTSISAEINKQTLLVLPQVHTALRDLTVENLFLLNNKHLFITRLANPVTLEEFESLQFTNIKTVRTFFYYRFKITYYQGWASYSTYSVTGYELQVTLRYLTDYNLLYICKKKMVVSQ